MTRFQLTADTANHTRRQKKGYTHLSFAEISCVKHRGVFLSTGTNLAEPVLYRMLSLTPRHSQP